MHVTLKYESGDKVFYKRKDMKGWRGAANVLGYDGTVVLVCYIFTKEENIK